MKRSTKAALLLATSMLFLTGCSKSSEIITIDNNQYVKSGDSYTRIGDSTKKFQPGEHYVYYNETIEYSTFGDYDNKYKANGSGWGNINFSIPTAPDGYRYLNTVTLDTYGHGTTNNIVHIFINEVQVEAAAVYNADNDTIGYYEPGTPVRSLALEQKQNE